MGPENKPLLLYLVDFYWAVPRQFRRERTVFKQMVLEKVDIYMQKNELDPCVTPYKKLTREWIM